LGKKQRGVHNKKWLREESNSWHQPGIGGKKKGKKRFRGGRVADAPDHREKLKAHKKKVAKDLGGFEKSSSCPDKGSDGGNRGRDLGKAGPAMGGRPGKGEIGKTGEAKEGLCRGRSW